jgi:hypothetical protein
MAEYIIGGIIAAIVIVLGAAIIRFNLKRLYIIRCAKAATDQQLEAIYTQIESLGTETPSCAALARTNRRSGCDADWTLAVPAFVQPGAGQSISMLTTPEVEFSFTSVSPSEAVLRGSIYRILPIPRLRTKTGKVRNQFSPQRCVAGSAQLSSALTELCPKYPIDFLSYLLTPGAETFEFDPMNQARFGGNPSWVQDPELPECKDCRKRMRLVLQLPGTLLPGKPLPRGTFFFFACLGHPKNTKTVAQFT